MSRVSTITCDTCEKEKHVSHPGGESPPKTCDACITAKEAAVREKHLAQRAALPLEERIALLEAFAYDHGRKFHPGRTPLF